MSSLPASISVLFERQSAPSLRQHLTTAFEAGDTTLFDGAIRWKLESFDAEKVWEGDAISFDDMAASLIGTLSGREDIAVLLEIEEK